MPANDALPEHSAMIITKGLQEWACLLSSDLPGETTKRLLCWSCQEQKLLSTSEVRRLVRAHGKLIRQQETQTLKALLDLEQDTEAIPDLRLVPIDKPRRPAAWPDEIRDAVGQALQQPDARPPTGVSQADWDRVLAARRDDPGLSVDQLARLGPRVAEGEVCVSVDDILVREPEKGHWLAVHTARVITRQGYRYFSGCSNLFASYLGVVLRLLARSGMAVTLLADGQSWIGSFFNEVLGPIWSKQYLLDWFHLRKKCRLLTSMICRSKATRAELLKALLRALFCGEVDQAILMLDEYRPKTKNEQVLDQLIGYIRARKDLIVDYRQRRQRRGYIGSGHAEKANDLIVARRQKRKGMHWRAESSEALAALKTLLLNREWDDYWTPKVTELLGA